MAKSKASTTVILVDALGDRIVKRDVDHVIFNVNDQRQIKVGVTMHGQIPALEVYTKDGVLFILPINQLRTHIMVGKK